MAQVLLQRPHIIVSVVGVPEAHADLNEYKGDEDEDMNDLRIFSELKILLIF